MRITFTNTTQTTLTNINIVVCGGGHIEKLENGESETVWVDINGDCSIGINYYPRDKRKKKMLQVCDTPYVQKLNTILAGKTTNNFDNKS